LKKLKNSKLLLLFIVAVIAVVLLHNVSKRPSESDLFVLPLYLNGISSPIDASDLSFEEQLFIINKLQQNMLSIAPEDKGIPEGQARGLQQLSFWGYGLCYDKSYALEILLEQLSFKTRHVSIYGNPEGTTWIKDLSTRGILSHACTEVLTNRGWLVIDPNFAWMALDKNGKPVSLASDALWADSNNFLSPPPYPIYTQDHHIVYGLYSRHGQFFWPYNFIPDYNIRGLLYNL
jgi:hypothetical protein